MPSFGAAPSAAAPSVFGAVLPTTRPDLPAQVAVSTGEEEDRTVFSVDGVLFEWDAEKRWRERGRGEVRVNVDQRSGQARVVMRQKGNLRLLLNGRLWPQMQITRLEGGGVSGQPEPEAGAAATAGNSAVARPVSLVTAACLHEA